MTRKLTLSVEDSVINMAKEYAVEHNESLSHLVENYFRALTSGCKGEDEISGVVRELMGSLNVPDDFDYNKAKGDYLLSRYEND